MCRDSDLGDRAESPHRILSVFGLPLPEFSTNNTCGILEKQSIVTSALDSFVAVDKRQTSVHFSFALGPKYFLHFSLGDFNGEKRKCA